MEEEEFYYDDPTQWGDYQYVTLESIVNDYIMSRDQDDYTLTVPRHKIVYQARQAFKEFHYDVLQEIRVATLDLNPDTLNITLPPDFVNYVRISYVDDNGMLQPMAKNDKMAIGAEYLQDHEYKILYDDGGCPLQDHEAYLGRIKGEGKNTEGLVDTDLGITHSYAVCSSGFEPNRNMSNTFINGSYKVDKARGIVQFDSSVGGQTIVLEYISDGLFTGCLVLPEREIRVHKFAEDAVRDSIYYKLIKQRRNVPNNEKTRARKEFYNSRRLSKLRLSTLRYAELIQSFKKQSKWIKN